MCAAHCTECTRFRCFRWRSITGAWVGQLHQQLLSARTIFCFGLRCVFGEMDLFIKIDAVVPVGTPDEDRPTAREANTLGTALSSRLSIARLVVSRKEFDPDF